MSLPDDFEQLLNAIADPIFVKDRQHRWIILNDAFCKLIGAERSDLIGKSDYDYFPESEAQEFWRKDEIVFTTGEANVNDEQFTDASGETHYITTKKVLHVTPRGEQFIVGCINDLTERTRVENEMQRAREELELKMHDRTLELAAINRALSEHIANLDRTSEQLRQSQKMEAIGQLAGGIAHDFNNLLNVIIGYGSLVERASGPDPKLKDLADHIIDAAETAASLTRQLLAFSRKQVLQPEVLELNELVKSVGAMLRRLIGEDIDLEIKVAADVGYIRVDRGQFEQVIINLAVNARDAMPSGGKLTIETSAAKRAAEIAKGDGTGSEFVAVNVIDTGKGIHPDVQAHIFEPFFTTKEQGKGTGLGLATVYGIVTQSNGRISVRSTPGLGTTFTILLPRIERPLSVAPLQIAAKASLEGSGNVLVVEDQEDLRILLRHILQSQGYHVIEAASGMEAIAKVSDKKDIDLLITDIIMPGMRGWELAQKLISTRKGLKVLYISGHTDTDLINEGALLEGGTFLEKPFRPEMLLQKVQEILTSGSAKAAKKSS
jgi:PAS domain S-box-containing protein